MPPLALVKSGDDMNKLKRRLIFIFIIVVVLLVIPLSINSFFSLEAPLELLAVDWNASDELSYIGSIIGGVGTIFLGMITISQTEQINRKNLENEKANTKRPFFIIEEISSDKKFDNNLWEQDQNGFLCFYNRSRYAYVKIKNVGDGVANNLMIEPWGFGHIPKEHRPNLCVPPESSCIIPIRLSEKDAQFVRFVQVIYENIVMMYSSEYYIFFVGK